MMSEKVLQLAVLAVVCGAALSIIPEGGTKNIAQILCTAILIICILDFLGELSFENYALESERLNEIEAAFSEKYEKSESELIKTVIEEQHREYILDKARELGISDLTVQIYTDKSADGLFVPYSVDISGVLSETQLKTLKEIIELELGIPKERQYWKYE